MICHNLLKIKDKINKSALLCNRDDENIKLVAVSKRKDIQKIKEAHQCGQVIFGENYLQEAQDKIRTLGDGYTWHFIGSLQSNKAKLAVELFDMIETVDRLKIAKLLNKYASQINKILDILIQVNIGREKQKSGVFPEETEALIVELKEMQHIRVQGLMAIPPNSNTEEVRSYFRALKELGDSLEQKKLFYKSDNYELSMGMSNDYPIAIAEGATMVRVGTALFGPRN